MATVSRLRPVKRVLVVNCYFDDTHRPARRPLKVPRALAPVFLAGAFSSQCDVRLFNEVASGPLEDADLLGWPDILVLTGLTNAFDRMLHLTAYARTRNPRVIVAAGGPAIRALPHLSRRFFDYACQGDVEELRDEIVDALGRAYAAEEMTPRYDLAYWIGSMGYAEASRSCNFRCSFCSLTGEGRKYQVYPLDDVRRQIVALGRRKRLFFVDNNFYGVDRAAFAARVELIRGMREAGYFGDWGALVASDFFHSAENLTRVQRAGCRLLFTGVESFDVGWLRDVNKLQNTRYSQVDLITRSLEHGVMFGYGLIVDGMHVDPAMLRLALRGAGHPLLVTDAMPPVGGSRSTFTLNGETVTVRDGRCVTNDGTLAGADLDMATAVRNCVRLLGASLPDALRFASTNPAAFLGLGQVLGRLAPGYRADLVAFDPNDMTVLDTWVAGNGDH